MRKHCPVSCRSEEQRPTNWSCKDAHPRCSVWADLGECAENSDMRKYCAKSCDTCTNRHNDDDLCVDTHENCRFWADKGECINNPVVSTNTCDGYFGRCSINCMFSRKRTICSSICTLLWTCCSLNYAEKLREKL
jgi:hypothetical protein